MSMTRPAAGLIPPPRFIPAPGQAGSGVVEFLVAAVPVLLLGLGGIELARGFYTKQALSLALLEAARAGITQNARPQAIKIAFQAALGPFYPPTATHSSAQRVQRALDRRRRATGRAPWQIEIISPSPRAFADFADGSLAIARQTGLAAINNDYQQEQDHARRAAGRVDGTGAASGQTIYQANYLTLRLTYPLEPLTPGLKAMMRILGSGGTGYSGQMMAQGYLPIVQEVQLAMQSHPVNWPGLADGTVTKAADPGPAQSVGGDTAGPGADARQPPPPDPDAIVDPGMDTSLYDANPPPGAQGEYPAAGLEVGPDDPACGVTLCCVG